ncbi:hypothetical protein HELRODRAFT_167840 [Helobdella robusta]|uniref:Uncharacterized protein n=1 Tax=Helobdella robusta TaxID=6412 RepID=T1EZV2_HELRO|nr:hypothetical protein HELRODRAFT_167840 [Helobdella robusta]ESO10003.1 hypothetical protein HELRODRAFT_167840 [Helobdella robusta]
MAIFITRRYMSLLMSKRDLYHCILTLSNRFAQINLARLFHWVIKFFELLISKFFIQYEHRGLVAKWLECPSTAPTTRVRILQFLQVHPGSRPPANPAVHPFEAGKWVDDVSCRMLAGEMAQWFKCALSHTSQWLSYTQRM